MNNEKGSVSVFIILIILPVFVFQAVLIEFARSKLAEQQVELAIKSAARSVGAMFDEQLQVYGLYGVADNTAVQDTFNRIVEGNLQAGFAGTLSGDGELILEGNLSDPGIFKEQILQEMKYKAPMEFARQITAKFKKSGIQQAMDDLSDFSERAGKTSNLLNKRNESLTQVMATWDDWNARAKNHIQALLDQLEECMADEETMRLIHAPQLRAEKENLLQEQEQMNELEEITETDEARLDEIDERISQIAGMLDEYEEWLGKVDRLQQSHGRLVQMTNDEYDKADKEIGDAEGWNEQLRQEVAGTEQALAQEAFQAVEIIADEDFARMRNKAAYYRNQISQWNNRISNAKTQPLGGLPDQIHSYAANWEEWMADVTAAEQERKTRQDELQKQEKSAQKQFDEQLSKVGALAMTCADDSDEKEAYKRLTEYIEAANNEEDYEHTRDAKEDAVGFADMIGQFTSQVTEAMYVNEYMLAAFNYRTRGGEKDKNGQAIKTLEPTLSAPESHKLRNQEVEYMLYGFSSCKANYSAAYWEIFAVRLAIRTTEQLLNPSRSWTAIGSPLLTFLLALAEGAVYALQDVEKLVDGQEVSISSKIAPAVTMNYKDYLRLFLLLHGQQAAYIRRVQALVGLNTGIELAERYTSWKAAASGRLTALFLANYDYRTKAAAIWGY